MNELLSCEALTKCYQKDKTALENVELAVQICRDPLEPAKVLQDVGLAERMNNFPAQLSGG